MRLADALTNQGKLREAEQSYRDAISAYRKYNGPVTDEFRETVNSLVALLKSQGKILEAQAVLDDVQLQR